LVPASPLRKVIRGVEVCYDHELDIVSHGVPSRMLGPLNRTQVEHEFDLCAEITTWCNLSCHNCFSNSLRGRPGEHLPYQAVSSFLRARHSEMIRFCITGGEPFMHPDIEKFLRLPSEYQDLAHVISTNGTLRPELDASLVTNEWLVAISLHGRQAAHDAYSGVESFHTIRRRIESLAPRTRTHLYCVVHDALTIGDIDWMMQFRTDCGVRFLRFIMPRAFGRYKPLQRPAIVEAISERLDSASGIKVEPSRTVLLEVSNRVRASA
jgi:sulfatase maturation enzyme AslB (radical SAM superfamily)